MLDDPALRDRLGARAAELAASHHGAARKAAEEILRRQDLFVPSGKPRGVFGPLLWLLARIWIAGRKTEGCAAIWRAPGASARRLSASGLSAWAAPAKRPWWTIWPNACASAAIYPAILTRGYRRRSIEPSIVVEAGEPVPVSVTGDEAQIYIHSGYAHAGIGADRFSTGKLLEAKYQPDMFLARRRVPAPPPGARLGCRVAGCLESVRQRGCLSPGPPDEKRPAALARADVLVIMRATCEREYAGLIQQLRAINPRAPIVRARVEPRYWVSHRTEQLAHPPEGPVAAFCGLGNPASFWTTLKRARIQPVFTWSFSDHHRYRWSELQRLAAQARMRGANILLCTEKDAANLPAGSLELLMEDSVELYWLKIGLEIENEDGLLELIESKLSR